MGAFLLSMLAFVGCCFIAGALTRNTDGTGKDKDHPIITFMRGLAVVASILFVIGLIFGILSLFIDIF